MSWIFKYRKTQNALFFEDASYENVDNLKLELCIL